MYQSLRRSTLYLLQVGVAPDVQWLAQQPQQQHERDLRDRLCGFFRLHDFPFALAVSGRLGSGDFQLQELMGDGAAVASQVSKGVQDTAGDQRREACEVETGR